MKVYLSDSAKEKKIAQLTKENIALKKQLEEYQNRDTSTSPVSDILLEVLLLFTYHLKVRPSSPPATIDGKQMFLDSPLFGNNRRKTFVVPKSSAPSLPRHSFIPPHAHVTLRRGHHFIQAPPTATTEDSMSQLTSVS